MLKIQGGVLRTFGRGSYLSLFKTGGERPAAD
jgi:hypothetical protein